MAVLAAVLAGVAIMLLVALVTHLTPHQVKVIMVVLFRPQFRLPDLEAQEGVVHQQ
jgi:uncharacterized membrane protein